MSEQVGVNLDQRRCPARGCVMGYAELMGGESVCCEVIGLNGDIITVQV